MAKTAQTRLSRPVARAGAVAVALALILTGAPAVAAPEPPPGRVTGAPPAGTPKVVGRDIPDTGPGPDATLPYPPARVGGVPMPAPKRIGELTARRTGTTKFFRLADGRVQAEVGQIPVHYRDGAGRWQDIDTTVARSKRSGYPLAVEKNTFTSHFGDRSDRLVAYSMGGRGLTMGLDGPARAVRPAAADGAVTFARAAGDADLEYEVTKTSVKEKIILRAAPGGEAVYRFSLRLDGVRAEQRGDGSVAFYADDAEGPPLFTLPKPFMYDSGEDRTSPNGKSWSNAVTQTVSQVGDRATLTIRADEKWLADPKRTYPVVIDPTIKIQPTLAQAQDVMINSFEPNANYDSLWRLSAGSTSIAVFRGLTRFDLGNVPAGTRLDSAQLQMYFDQVHTTDDFDVPIEARRVTANWAENTVTWNSINAQMGEVGQNADQVDNAETSRVSTVGEWKGVSTGDATGAIGGSYRTNSDATTGHSFTWVPRLTETGTYEVQVHYVPGANRTTAAPYTVHHAGGQATVNVNQTTGSGNGAWRSLGSWSFNAGTTHRVVLGDSAGKVVVADAVRLIKRGTDVKRAHQTNAWHNFSVRSIVQDWLDGRQPNYGFMVKGVDETLADKGGPRYESGDFSYGGEDDHGPKLLLTWGKPGVTLHQPTTIRATGADLSWTAYADPSSSPDDDVIEYQVHASRTQNFMPSAATLVAPVKPWRTSYADTHATPTPANSTAEFGDAFFYMVAVKTRDGTVLPAPTELVRLPKAGQVVKFYSDAIDNTLTSKQPTVNHDVLDAGGELQVGNNGSIYGTSRVVLKFPPLTGLPANTKVIDAEVGLWSWYTEGGGANFQVRGLTRDFDETTSTWNSARVGTAWTTPGGDAEATVQDTVGGMTGDPGWQAFDAAPLVQRWINDPASNKGVLVRLENETSPTQRVLFLSAEAAEPTLRPRLRVVYTAPNSANTYHAPTTPGRMIPGDEYSVPVTLTNTTTSTTWSPSEYVLSYRWERFDGTDATTADNRRETPLPSAQAPGGVVTIDAAVKAPAGTGQGNRRESYVLKWDLRNSNTGQWLSQSAGIEPLDQGVAVEHPTSDQLGLEKFYQYTGGSAGAGSTVMINQYSGNGVFSYNPFNNPSRGVSTFVRLTHNTQDNVDSFLGHGWSLSTSSAVRLGSPLQFRGGTAHWPAQVEMTDGDGTTHQFRLNKHGSTNEADWRYDQPAGVHLYLQRTGSGDSVRAWTMTRPDRSQFVFDRDGYQTVLRDRNGNELLFTYERKSYGNRNCGILRYLTDPAGRQTLTLEYYEAGEDYAWFDGATRRTGANLGNHHIIGKLRSIADVSGRKLEFVYGDEGLLREITDGAGTAEAKVFGFTYDETDGSANAKLIRIDDPRRKGTKLTHHDASADEFLRGRVSTLTDRVNKFTSVEYSDPDGNASGQIMTAVTDARGHVTQNLIDGFGRATRITDALDHVTELTWDADNNVERLTEADGAVTTWRYDQLTGYPLEVRDPEANRNNTPATRLGYRSGLHGHTAELIEKVSPEGRKWSFGYDALGNITSVTDPKGTATALEGDFTTSYSYNSFGQLTVATDANEHTTRYADFDVTGFPRRVTDALQHDETYTYSPTGDVTAIVNAQNSRSEYTYDVFGRPLTSREPKAAGVFITTPAPVYDKNDNITQETAPNGAVSTATYDDVDRLATLSEPKDTPTSPARTSSFGYDAVGNLIRETKPKGTLTTAINDFTTTYVYDELDRIIQATDAASGKVNLVYDSVGNVVTEIDQRKNATTDPHDFTLKYEYDRNRRLIVTTDAAGFTTRQEYDRDGNVTAAVDQDGNRTTMAFDERSSLREQRVPHKRVGTDITYRTTRFEYDEVGNQTRVESPRGVDTTDDPNDFATVTVYDELNRVKEVQQPYDRDDVRYTTPPKTIYTYNAVGDLTTISAPPAEGGTTRIDTVNTHFLNGWIRTSTDPWGIRTEYEYDDLGLQTSRKLTGPTGPTRELTSTYFPDGKRRTQSDNGAGTGTPRKSFTYTYDPNANLTEMRDESTDAKIDQYVVSYDGLDRVASVEEKLGGAIKNTTTLEYEANDLLRRRTHDRQVSDYTYNSRDLPEQIRNAKSATDEDPKTTRYEYTKRAEVSKETKGNGNVVDLQYFLDGAEQHQVESKPNGTVVNEHTYEYTANGHRARDVAHKQNADNRAAYLDTTTTYEYDPQDRVRRLTKTGHGADTESYVHDANSNVISQTVGGQPTTFNYDRNRLVSASIAGVPSTYSYDPYGRLRRVVAANTELERYEYDGFDRVTEHARFQAGTTTYKYDPLDRQVQRVHGGKTTDLVYLGLTEQTIAEIENGKVVKTYQYRSDGTLLSQVKTKADNTEEDSYTGYNAHSDVEQLTDEQGESRATYGYTAYGKNDSPQFTGVDKPAAGPDDPNHEPYNAFRFNGKRYDQSTGDYDMGFRDYDPGLNRYLARDQYNGALSDLALAVDPYTGNRYGFAGGNPISNVELDGHNWLSDAISDIGSEALEWGKETLKGLDQTLGDLEDASATNVGGDPKQQQAAQQRVYNLADTLTDREKLEAALKPGYDEDAGNPVRQGTRAFLDVGSLFVGGGASKGGLAKGAPGGIPKGAPRAGAPAPGRGSAAARNCVSNSFVPGTQVLLANGTHRAIEEVAVGDKVLATDPESGETQARPVTRLITGEGTKELVEVTVDTDGDAGKATGAVVATRAHPFWVDGAGRWMDAGDLRVGDEVSTRYGERLAVVGLRAWTQVRRVYNLTVDGIHTYYVSAGGGDLLVHNCAAPAPRGMTSADANIRNLSAVGKQNVRSLRAWAKQRGFTRSSAPGPEVWGVTQPSGSFSWRLKIKAEASLGTPGLQSGSHVPRFDARLDAMGTYVNPFTGQRGGKSVGTHLELERDWRGP
jgi:RHS repeat-associated protein